MGAAFIISPQPERPQKENRPKTERRSAFVGHIEDDILHGAVEYTAEVVDLHRTDPLAFFNAVDSRAAYPVLDYQRIGGDVL